MKQHHPLLKSKLAIVTGGSRGIGKAIVERLVFRGCDVHTFGKEVVDVRSDQQIQDYVNHIEHRYGPIDILVNNAGIGLRRYAIGTTTADWDRVLDTNLKGAFLFSRAVLPGMIGRQSGDIVNISSMAGKNAFAGGAAYCASKWGLQGLTYAMAEESREHGIRVGVICPGRVATEKDSRGSRLEPSDVADAVEAMLTMRRHAFISEIHLRPTEKP